MSKLTREQAKVRLKQLRDLINDYRYQYHVLDKSIMSEAAADSLKHELTELETQYPDLITADSPSQRVAGEPLPGFSQVKHTSRMLSLNDVFSRQELEAWAKRVQKLAPDHKPEYFADVKMDGLAVALWYLDGVLQKAVTRGDGFTGEDVTTNIRTLDSVPTTLRHDPQFGQFLKGRTEIRGEVIIHKNDFETLNKQRQKDGQPLYANPRNTAAGSIRQLDPKLAAARPLRFRAWDILRDDASEVPTNTYAYQAIRALGIAANGKTALFKDIDGLMKHAAQWEKKRHDLPYNTDGLVIKLNDRALYAQLGVVGKAPRGAVAFKYAAEEATTVVKDIVLSIGRTGAATPVAVFDPVVVAGTTVQHASLHNADEITRKDIRVGDTVIIFKAGDIIPQVSRVLTELRPKNAKKFDMPKELQRQYPELEFVRPEGEAVYRVKGETSDVMLKRGVIHFASKSAMDIDTLGEKNVIALVDAGLVKDMADIYALTKDQVLQLDRFAEVSANNLITAIAAAKKPELPRFIYGLGIRHVGQQTGIDLAEHFGSIDKLAHATLDELMLVEGIGDVVAESILAWFADPDNERLLKKFEKLAVKPHFESRARGPLHGKSFVITGTLEHLGRDEAADRIRALGGTFQTSVGKDTSYLVVGQNVGASKLTKAQKLGTKQITETQLLNILEGKQQT
jgi:DNA ligase (NAD+)